MRRVAALAAVLGAAMAQSPTRGPTQAWVDDGFFTSQALASDAVQAVYRTPVGQPSVEDIVAKMHLLRGVLQQTPYVPSLPRISYTITALPEFLRTNGYAPGSHRITLPIEYSGAEYAAAGPKRFIEALKISFASTFHVHFDQLTSFALDAKVVPSPPAATFSPTTRLPPTKAPLTSPPTKAPLTSSPTSHPTAPVPGRRAATLDASVLHISICSQPHGCNVYQAEDDEPPTWIYPVIIPSVILLIFIFCLIWTKVLGLSCDCLLCNCCAKEKEQPIEPKEVSRDEPFEEGGADV